MHNSGQYVRLCVHPTILICSKFICICFLDFFVFDFLKFLKRLCIYRSNGLWSGATPISDGIFWDIWDRQIYWKMSRIKSVTSYNWRHMKGKDFQTPLWATRIPSNTPKHPWTLQNTPSLMSWICQGSYGSVSGYLRVSRGSWMVYGWLRGVSGSLFPSFAFNCRKSQI